MFYVDIEPNYKNRDIYNVEHISNAIVNIEPPRKTYEIVQCYRCQDFGLTLLDTQATSARKIQNNQQNVPTATKNTPPATKGVELIRNSCQKNQQPIY